MKQLRCNECGTVYSAQLTICPECGCPATDSVVVDEEDSPPNREDQVKGKNITMEPERKNVQRESQYDNHLKPQKKKKTFEIICYCLAGLCALSAIFTSTTNGGYVNFDGSNSALRSEIAAFGWLIVGRITALINK